MQMSKMKGGIRGYFLKMWVIFAFKKEPYVNANVCLEFWPIVVGSLWRAGFRSRIY